MVLAVRPIGKKASASSAILLAPVAVQSHPAQRADCCLTPALRAQMAQHGLLPCQVDSYLQTLRTTVLRRGACCPACCTKPVALCQGTDFVKAAAAASMLCNTRCTAPCRPLLCFEAESAAPQEVTCADSSSARASTLALPCLWLSVLSVLPTKQDAHWQDSTCSPVDSCGSATARACCTLELHSERKARPSASQRLIVLSQGSEIHSHAQSGAANFVHADSAQCRRRLSLVRPGSWIEQGGR